MKTGLASTIICVAMACIGGYAVGKQHIDPPPKPVWMTSTDFALTFGIWRKYWDGQFQAIFIIEGPMESKGKSGAYPEYEVHRKTIKSGAINRADGYITIPDAFPNYSTRYGTYQWRFSVHNRVVLRGSFNSKVRNDGTQIVMIKPTQLVDKPS